MTPYFEVSITHRDDEGAIYQQRNRWPCVNGVSGVLEGCLSMTLGEETGLETLLGAVEHWARNFRQHREDTVRQLRELLAELEAK